MRAHACVCCSVRLFHVMGRWGWHGWWRSVVQHSGDETPKRAFSPITRLRRRRRSERHITYIIYYCYACAHGYYILCIRVHAREQRAENAPFVFCFFFFFSSPVDDLHTRPLPADCAITFYSHNAQPIHNHLRTTYKIYTYHVRMCVRVCVREAVEGR